MKNAEEWEIEALIIGVIAVLSFLAAFTGIVMGAYA